MDIEVLGYTEYLFYYKNISVWNYIIAYLITL